MDVTFVRVTAAMFGVTIKGRLCQIIAGTDK